MMRSISFVAVGFAVAMAVAAPANAYDYRYYVNKYAGKDITTKYVDKYAEDDKHAEKYASDQAPEKPAATSKKSEAKTCTGGAEKCAN